jgi:hypothetical protein
LPTAFTPIADKHDLILLHHEIMVRDPHNNNNNSNSECCGSGSGAQQVHTLTLIVYGDTRGSAIAPLVYLSPSLSLSFLSILNALLHGHANPHLNSPRLAAQLVLIDSYFLAHRIK